MRSWWNSLSPGEQLLCGTVAGTWVALIILATVLPLIGGPWR